MSLPIDVLQELYLAEREKTKALKEKVSQLSNEVEQLGNELSSARNNDAETRGEERSASENDENTTESGEDMHECLEPQLTDAEDLYRNLQTTLNMANESNRVMRLTLDAAHDSNRELGNLISELQTTLDSVDQHEALGDDSDVEELRVSHEQLQWDLVAVNDTNRELRISNEQLQLERDAAYDAEQKLYDLYVKPGDLNGELQLALDDADKPETSGDEEIVQEQRKSLREIRLELDTAHFSIGELQEKNKLLRNHLKNAVAGDWKHVRPYLDEKFWKCCIDFKAELHGCRVELVKVNDELSNTNKRLVGSEAKSKELQEENSALLRELNSMRAASKVDAQKQKPRKAAAKGKAKLTPTEREMLRLKNRKSLHIS